MFYNEDEDELVVSLRGTENHIDALNDLDCEYTKFFDGFAHSGFVKLAHFFIQNHVHDINEGLKKYKTTKFFLQVNH